ncbi:MAG: hypothetical protein QOI83_2579 [Streptomycetaceae bacterium]|nr:hypothetical protein [Streptomycetaceae bacterium]
MASEKQAPRTGWLGTGRMGFVLAAGGHARGRRAGREEFPVFDTSSIRCPTLTVIGE